MIYDDGHHAIHDFNLQVKAGETVALVGRSGAGKTSLVNLLVRYQDATSGQILLDGKPIEDFEITALRTQIAMVNQQVVLFNRTVRENIAYGQLGRCFQMKILSRQQKQPMPMILLWHCRKVMILSWVLRV